jgi:hypothetical protein
MRRGIAAVAALVLAVPLALLLNEMFGMPPVFTPELEQPAALAGVWSGVGVTLNIAPDGTVFGVFGQDQVYRAKLSRNRTWVGRTLNWRTDYIIMGRSGDHRFTAPFNMRDGRIHASFFIFERELKPAPASVVLERGS